ncbi:MAG TPA: energy-coupling factor transporter ATPase [Clostridia bacterium]|nr:energy-coupling factor transporter ATPase [Clostridia bacterium]
MNDRPRSPLISTENLVYEYPGGVRALNGISLEIYEGEFVAIIGQNGAGKSTLVKHFNGLLKPTSGRCVIASKDTRDCKVTELARVVGYVFQNPDHQIFSETIEKEIEFGPKNLGLDKDEVKRRVKEAAEAVGLSDKLDQHPLTLSKGDRQRLAIASVMAMRPKAIVIDEPTTGQDYQGGQQIMSLVTSLHSMGHTLILISHNMELVAEYAHRVIVMCGGEILADGSPAEVFGKPDVLAKTFLEAPQITRIAQRLQIPETVFSSGRLAEIVLGRGA